MKPPKNCFFKNTNTINPTTLFSNLIHMVGKNTLAITALSAVLAIALPAKAEEKETAKQEQIICKTKEICQKLTESIQTQINELEAKGLGNLSKDERIKYLELSDNLIATEKSETYQNQNLITSENQKQEEQRKTIETKLQAQDQKLAELRGALLEK